MKNLISVIMPVYNGQDYLAEAIKSILNQSFSDFEFIIIDDCSTDNSLEIAEYFLKQDNRIKITKLAKNIGIVGALNVGLNVAQGKYIARMDADDISVPERLEKQYSFLENHPEVGLVSSDVSVIDSSGKIQFIIQMPQTKNMINWAFCYFDPIVHPTVMVKNSLISLSGGYRNQIENEEDYFPEDYDLWVRIIRNTEFYNLSEPLLRLRKHDNNITKKNEISIMKNSIRVCGWYLQSLNSPKIKASDAELLWNPVTDANVLQTFKVLRHLYHYFISKEGINDQEKYYIQNDFICRINTLINYSSFGFQKIIIYVYKRIYQIQFLLSKFFRKIFSK